MKSEKEKKKKGRERKKEDEVKNLEEKKESMNIEEYRKAGVYIGTKIITGHMKPYVFRRKADGLAVIDIEKIDEKIKAAGKLISQYEPEEIIVVGKKESCWKILNAFSKYTKIRVFTKKYPPGIITNPSLENFFEPSLVIVVDPWIDKNVIKDALKKGVPIIGLCDTNNVTNNLDLVIPCNNKSEKSLGLIFYVLAKEFLKNKNIKIKIPKGEFIKEEPEK